MKIRSVFFFLVIVTFFSCQKKTKLSNKRDFSIKNIEEIDSIKIQNKTPKTVFLLKNNKQWELKNGFPVRKEAINLLLETIRDMQIKRPVALKERENIIKRMSVQRTQVEIFSKNKTIKTIYVGGDTQDQLGTYMILKDSSEPYVLSIPGFNGYLSSRFSCEENTWKEKIIFNFQKEDIENVELNYRDSKNSFQINKKDSLSNQYFSNFEKISCEKFLKNNRDFNIEEIKRRDPIFDIKITLKNKKEITLKAFEKKSSLKGRTKNKTHDTEKFYALFQDELILIQYQQFQNILKKKTDFK